EHVKDDSVFVTEWAVAEGTRVEAGSVVCSIETSKAIVEIEAPGAGFVRQRAQPGDEVPIGGILGYVSAAADTALPDAQAARPDAGEPGQISAKARRKMAELNLDPA